MIETLLAGENQRNLEKTYKSASSSVMNLTQANPE
jgi:hypothetical protein